MDKHAYTFCVQHGHPSALTKTIRYWTFGREHADDSIPHVMSHGRFGGNLFFHGLM